MLTRSSTCPSRWVARSIDTMCLEDLEQIPNFPGSLPLFETLGIITVSISLSTYLSSFKIIDIIMIFSICSQFYFWLSLLCSGIPRLTLVDSIMWIHSLEDQLGSWEALAGGGAVGRERPWVLLPYPSATFLAAFCGWCPAGFHNFTNIVSAPSCPSSPGGANSSLLLPVFGAPGFSSVPLSFQQSFYKIFLFLFWTICGELGLPDGYHSTGKAGAFLPIVPKLLLQHQDLSLGLFQWHSLFQLLFRPSLLFFLHFLFLHLLPPAACAPAPWWCATGKLGVLQEHRHDSAQGAQMVGGWLCHWSQTLDGFTFFLLSLQPPWYPPPHSQRCGKLNRMSGGQNYGKVRNLPLSWKQK